MDLVNIIERTAELAVSSPLNLCGAQDGQFFMYTPPDVCVADADDPLFDRLKSAIGPHFLKPAEWLENAASVISVFAPLSERVRRSNGEDFDEPSYEWLCARYEGQTFINAVCASIVELLYENGCDSVAPSQDKRFRSLKGTGAIEGYESSRNAYTSNWSERHVAFVSGHGTFGLSGGLITRHGTAGRLGSVVTTLRLKPTARAYTGVYGYCARCGACASHCPAGAISMEDGKNHALCSGFLDKMKEKYSPRHACGKCQVKTPCEYKNPVEDGAEACLAT